MKLLPHRQDSSTPQDSTLAQAAGQRLSRLAQGNRPVRFQVEADPEGPIELPASALALFVEILEAMAAGRGVTLILEKAELSTVEAADALNVSRPFLIKLLNEGAIPYRKVGKHRRVRKEDVMTFKMKIDREREAALDRLVADAQEQDMGYGRP
jgi:excisionase family DNA binding protein